MTNNTKKPSGQPEKRDSFATSFGVLVAALLTIAFFQIHE
jgi:hypothetical protein